MKRSAVILLALLSLTSATLVTRARARQSTPKVVGVAPYGESAIEFIGGGHADFIIGRIFGYITHIAGLKDNDLFFTTSPMNERTARFTYFADQFVDRHGAGTLFDLSGSGQPLNIFLRTEPGATFDNVFSFGAGTLIAKFDERYRYFSTALPGGGGTASETADLGEEEAHAFAAGGQTVQLGRPGVRYRLQATGTSSLAAPLPFIKANFVLGGDMRLANP